MVDADGRHGLCEVMVSTERSHCDHREHAKEGQHVDDEPARCTEVQRYIVGSDPK